MGCGSLDWGGLAYSTLFMLSTLFLLSSHLQPGGTQFYVQPDKPIRRKEHIYLTKDNIDSLFERFPKGTSSFVPLQIAYHTGMRPGEVFGLVWDDIDFDNKVINVNRQIQWRQVKRSKKDIKKTNGTSESLGYWYFTSPKYKSYRVIDIDDVLVSCGLICKYIISGRFTSALAIATLIPAVLRICRCACWRRRGFCS